MNTLAIIVPLTRESDARYAKLNLCGQWRHVHELILIEDGCGNACAEIVAEIVAAFPLTRIVRYRSCSFFLGAWKPVVDSLTSSHVFFLPPGLLLGKGYLESVLEWVNRHLSAE